MLRAIRHVLAIWSFTNRRLLSQPALTSALLLGWLATIGLVAAIPMYTDAINQALLSKELQHENSSRRPAFSFFFHFLKTGSTEARWDAYAATERYIREELAPDLRLPVQTHMHYVKSDLFQLFPTEGQDYRRGEEPLTRVSLGFLSDFENQAALLEGMLPSPWGGDGPISVLVAAHLAEELGLQVGEIYSIFIPIDVSPSSSDDAGREPFTAPVRIAGVWQAHNRDSRYWYIPPSSFNNTFLVSPDSYAMVVDQRFPKPLYDVGWYLALDGGRVRAENVAGFLQRQKFVRSRLASLMNGVRISLSPEAALLRYQKAVSAQSILVLLLGLPVVGLILTFVSMIARSIVDRQQLEIAILKSRGSSRFQVAGIYVIESLTIGVVAFVGAIPLAWLATQGIGAIATSSAQMDAIPLLVSVTADSLIYAIWAAVVTFIVTLIPALQSARFTVVGTKQSIGREVRKHVWRNAAIDLLLLAMAGYGYYLLDRQGQIVELVWGEATDPWENPLLFVAPTLFLLASGRLLLRLLPPALLGIEALAAWTNSITLLLTSRNVARSRGQYRTILTLLSLTIALGTYVTSVAHTLDENLLARTSYRIGASVALVESFGRVSGGEPGGITVASSVSSGASREQADGPTGWAFLPVREHEDVPGVLAATRVGLYPASVRVRNRAMSGHLFGIDRSDFPQVAYFRRDFAVDSLGALMNALATSFSGVLVRDAFLAEAGLAIGDPVELRGLIPGSSQPLLFTIVGTVDMFPTAYPADGELFVANLEYIFQQLGGTVPYLVWLAVDEHAELNVLVSGLAEKGFDILKIDDVRQIVAAEQTRPERLGLFGFFSLGFMVTTVLSILALTIHAILMYQRRSIQLGIMRALGLSSSQVAASLIYEQILVSTYAILGGALLGLVTSHIYIPYMQIGYEEIDLIPPFHVVIAWQDVSQAALVLLLASAAVTAVVVRLLSRLQIFKTVKMGEALA